MRRNIFKYKVTPLDHTLMPKDAQIIHVDSQGEEIFVWAIVNTSAEMEKRSILVYPTGNGFPDQFELGKNVEFIGTVKMESRMMGLLMFHVFERLEE